MEFQQRLAKLGALKEAGVDPYPNDFKPGTTAEAIIAEFGPLDAAALEAGKGSKVSVAGRIMGKRDFGKASFVHIQDRTGRIQAYMKKDLLGEEGYNLFRLCDMGDIVGVEGSLFRTKTGELTIEAAGLRLLAKGLHPLPEKWHGLTDVEARYRQRYLDLMVNPEVKEVFVKRSRIIKGIRDFLTKKEFMEVETPMLQPIPGGATARPFKTYHNALQMELFMRIAPELYLKRLIVAGLERVFEINRNFRNEGISTQHNPEFTMLEFYLAYSTFEDLMDLTEDMISSLALEITGSMKVTYQGTELDFTPPWTRISVREAILKYSDATVDIFADKDKAVQFSKKIGLSIPEGLSHGKVLTEIFEEVAEPRFIQPTFITLYPLDVSPLSRKNSKDPAIVDRFELMVAGREIANAFSELNDPIDQRERFVAQLKEKAAGDAEAHEMDDDFVRALEYGMPPTAGEGIGIDRLVMLLTDSPSIRDVILFPQLRK
ncbi:MAG TPA: lysine--tRNA ligase [Deltaproteobacteria bacterium]|nr:lysine--tRNA ligase [Deltaproteobacteria bacterium]HCY11395.1 lysine--tRNA ligase [Deltaproteobacteria bacterium]